MKESNRIALCNAAIVLLVAMMVGLLAFACVRIGQETARPSHSITLTWN